ncbi:MAG: hypothetical protein JWL77_6948, partial [Chthonomonadaceae bacterium]|nr:hypothetical protein [Chthonomonadaceae bacterium]
IFVSQVRSFPSGPTRYMCRFGDPDNYLKNYEEIDDFDNVLYSRTALDISESLPLE